ncbi:MAG: dipicolinate synthase subunit DpsA [Lachnospiraceae bacterium]|nr:dipicolinate synthase subunit DpsA [Lachnospiraceae bacterium]
MKTDFNRIAVIGGDMRQVYLAEILAQRGYEVSVYALERKTEHPAIKEKASLREALKDTDVLLAPMPFLRAEKLKKAGNVWQKGSFSDLTVENLLKYAKEGSLIFAGGISEEFRKQAAEKQIRCVDYLKNENIAVQNTVAAAEGMIAEAICRSPGNLSRSSCLVLGYGKCGATLVFCLQKFSCRITVYEKEAKAAARAGIIADKVAEDSELPMCLANVQYIFNTIPSIILTESLLSYVKKGTLILDLASAPGGVDYNAAGKLGIQAVLLPGLPGKYAPLSSAKILAEAVMRESE